MEPSREPSGFSQLFAEMRRRHVVRFALGYAAAAFVVLQLAEIVFPAFGIGEGGLRVLVVLTGLGFLPALVLAWVYDVTTEGITRTEDDGTSAGPPSRLALSALLLTTVLVTGGLGLYLADQGVLSATDAQDRATDGVLAVAYDPSQPIRSLAVLPLDDFSPSGDQAYFTLGMHEELIAKLSMLEDVRVVSRTTVMQYADAASRPSSPEIGRDLGVDVLVEGSVSRDGDHVRVTLQIIHASSDSHIETLQWDRDDVEDVLAFQSEIAHAVVHEIQSDHDEATFGEVVVAGVDPDAQEAYLKARMEYDRGTSDGYRMALEYFEEALDEDSTFAAAMAGAAGARFLVSLEDPEASEQELSLAREEAFTALRMDSSSMEAKEIVSLIERGMPHVVGSVEIDEQALDGRGIQVVTMPGTFDSVRVDVTRMDTTWIAAVTGLGERIQERIRRLEVDARLGESEAAMGARHLVASGRYREASHLLEDLVAQSPEFGPAWDMLARAHVAAGDPIEAVAVVSRWQASGAADAPDEASVLRLRETVAAEGARGYWRWKLERLTARDAAGQPVPRVDMAAAHAALGQTDEAFAYLFEALAAGEPGLFSLRTDPLWDDLRRDSRFRELVRQVQVLRFSPTRRPRIPPRSGG